MAAVREYEIIQHPQIDGITIFLIRSPIAPRIPNIEERMKKVTEEKSALGIFKGKEKKALQEQIDQVNVEKKSVQDRMDAAKKEIEAKIASAKAETQKKIEPLQNRVHTISNKLTKAR